MYLGRLSELTTLTLNNTSITNDALVTIAGFHVADASGRHRHAPQRRRAQRLAKKTSGAGSRFAVPLDDPQFHSNSAAQAAPEFSQNKQSRSQRGIAEGSKSRWIVLPECGRPDQRGKPLITFSDFVASYSPLMVGIGLISHRRMILD